MTDDDQYQRALEALDANLHYLLEDLENSSLEDTLQQETIHALRQARSAIDPALLALRQHEDIPTTNNITRALQCQWDPADTPPRRLVIEPATEDTTTTWRLRELEWTGSGWRRCRDETIDDVAIHAPATPTQPDPADPPTLEALLDELRERSTQSDPPTLVFEASAHTPAERGFVVAVDDELRYREQDGENWYTVSEADLEHHLQQHGQPTLVPLSETPFMWAHFTSSPLTHLESTAESKSESASEPESDTE